jgi:2-methylcitrate dehydratase PrpD
VSEGAIARRIARFALAPPPLPDAVRTAADRAILDTLGVMVAGGVHPAARAARAAAGDAPGPATMATRGRGTAEAAALVNGAAAHAWDFDDTSYTGIMHGSAAVLPVAMALAQEMGAGPDALRAAFVVGSETVYALADVVSHAHYFAGWWSTATLGLVGAAVAAARLLRLDEDAATAAIGTAAAAASGGKAVFGTGAKPFLVGDAGRRAIGIARACAAGLTGPERGVEDARGLALLAPDGLDLAALDDLGLRWRLTDPGLMVKTSPVCSAAHAAIELMVALRDELNVSAGEIDAIEAEVPHLVAVSLVHDDPRTPEEAQFSLPYALACAARHGMVRFEDLAPEALHEPETRRLMALVRTTEAPDLSTDAARAAHPEGLRLTVGAGRRRASGFLGAARGTEGRPLSDGELQTKFEASVRHAGRRPVSPQADPAAAFERIMQ